MKQIHTIATGLAVLALASSVQAAIIGISTDKPTDNIVAQTSPDGTSNVGFDTETSGGERYAWGQSFTVGAGGSTIDAISLQQGQNYGSYLEADATRQMKIALFSYDLATFNNDEFGTFTDPFNGQTTQPIYTEIFDASARVATKRWVTFDLTTDQTLAAGTYGFMVWVDGARDTWIWSGSTDNTYSDGTRLRVRDADAASYEGNSSGGGDLNFTVQAIPEPATLGLVAVFGGAVLFIRRWIMI